MTTSKLIIRQLQEKDAHALLTYLQTIFDEAPFLVTTNRDFNQTVEQQRQWITQFTANDLNYGIIALLDGNIVGFLSFQNGGRERTKHTGSFGITVMQQARGKGIGTKMLQQLLDWTTAHPTIEKICLEVFSQNKKAIELYEKLGFGHEGSLKRAIKYEDGTYDDLLLMAKWVKDNAPLD